MIKLTIGNKKDIRWTLTYNQHPRGKLHICVERECDDYIVAACDKTIILSSMPEIPKSHITENMKCKKCIAILNRENKKKNIICKHCKKECTDSLDRKYWRDMRNFGYPGIYLCPDCYNDYYDIGLTQTPEFCQLKDKQ